MRFEIAVAAVLAPEGLSSSLVAAQGTSHRSDLLESARLRKEAIEAISNSNPKGRQDYHPFQRIMGERQRKGGILRERWNLFEAKLRQFSEDKIRQLSGATNQQRKIKGVPGAPTSDSDFPDLGILLSTPTKEQRKSPEDIFQHFASIGNAQLKNKGPFGDPGPSSYSALPDLGVLSSVSTKEKRSSLKNRIRKLSGAAKPQRHEGGSSGDLNSHGTLPDLGIFSPARTMKQRKDKIPLDSTPSGAQKEYRRLGDYYPQFDYNVEDAFEGCDFESNPAACYAKLSCAYLASFDTYGDEATPACETCNVTTIYDPVTGLPTAEYNVEIDCPNFPNESVVSQVVQSFDGFCDAKVCQTCSLDTDNFQFDLQNCSLSRSGIVFDIKPGNNSDLYFCNHMAGIDNKLWRATPSCEPCQITRVYDPDTGYATGAYNKDIFCPNIHRNYINYTSSVFQAYNSSSSLCQTNIVDTENFLIDRQNCSIDPYGPGGGVIQALKLGFDSYFASFCEAPELTQQLSCRSCGQKFSNESSFSFEVDCPSKLSASDSGFGSYLLLAEIFCSCPARSGVQCSTCEVNPWESTINIEDCVSLGDYSEEQSSCANSDEYALSDQAAFIGTYASACNLMGSYYLQDSIGAPNCNCTFDESTQTSSISCLHDEECGNVSSFCPEKPLEFCRSYQIDTFFSRDSTASLQWCFNFSSPYEFSYCVSYGTTKGDAVATAPNDTTKPQGSIVCEMEVDGIRCNSCSPVHSKDGYLSTSTFSDMASDILYNCSNTVIGTNGPGNLSTYRIVEDTISYFAYKSLPCLDGCDLCGVGDMGGPKNEFMTNPDGKFASEYWKNGIEERCFDAQIDAMTRNQIMNNKECQAIRDSAREPCGCTNSNPPPPASGAHSFGRKTAAAGVVLLTMASASVVQMLLG